MKRMVLIPLLTWAGIAQFSKAFSSAVVSRYENNDIAYSNSQNISEFKIKDIEKLTGKKLSLRQKIELKILKITLNKKLFNDSLLALILVIAILSSFGWY
jgi:hypothetical protein